MSDDILASLRRKTGKVRLLFNTALGLEVLEILADEFDAPDLRGSTVEDTYFQLGRRDVLVYIKQLLEAEMPE